MQRNKKGIAALCSVIMIAGNCGCYTNMVLAEETAQTGSDKEYIEQVLNLDNNEEQEWTYSQEADAWTLSVVSAVAYPELPDQQGVSVCVPGAYVTGIDQDGDGTADVTAADLTGSEAADVNADDAGEEAAEVNADEEMADVHADNPGEEAADVHVDDERAEMAQINTASAAVQGSLVINYEAEITSSNGQVYTAATAPVILNTGAAGYGSQNNSAASTSHAADGYINVSCGNRGKNDSVTDEEGNTHYTGDAPSCLVDQKAAARYVKYNILLGNLPGNADYFVSTGGSGGGAHATMFAATSNNSDFYDYQIEAGAVGVYKNEDGTYSTTVTIDGADYEISDGAWGCIAYSAITSLYEADMALAFEYYLNTEYTFNTSFQAQLAEYLSESYMEYINEQNLSVDESAVGFDLNEDGDLEDNIALTIECDPEAYPETNGYYGTYLDLYLAEFQENLQWYLDNLDYAEGWTWFDADGNALSDEAAAAMTSEEKAQAFVEGRYTKGSSGMSGPGGIGGGMMMGGMPDGMMGNLPDGMMDNLPEDILANLPDGMELPGGTTGEDTAVAVDAAGGAELPEGMTGELPEGAELPEGMTGELPEGAELPEGMTGELPEGAELPEGMTGELTEGAELPDGIATGGRGGNRQGKGGFDKADIGNAAGGPGEMIVGTPDAGTTQSATGKSDSANYATYEEMVEAYKADIEEVYAGDKYGKNIVSLYNPLNYIGAEGTENPTWTKIIMGAAEGDLSMFNSLNLQIAWLNAGVDAEIEWQWDGGHVPSEVLGDSFSLYVDQMYGEYVEGAAAIEKASAEPTAENGISTEASGTDISSWVNAEDITDVEFTLADAAAYRTAGASKAMPGFDVIDYGQEDYVFGDEEQDARHWNTYLLEIFEEHADVLEPLFNLSE